MTRPWTDPIVRVRGALWSLMSTAAGLGLAIWLVPGVAADAPWALLVAALAVGVGDALLRPLLQRFARTGVLGALVAGVAAQVTLVWAALTWAPGIRSGSWADVLAVLVLAAVVMAVGHWLVGVQDNVYVLGDLLQRARRQVGVPDPRSGGDLTDDAERPAGLLLVVLDGVARPTLDHAVQAGLAPTLARWLASGSHRVESWWACVPATTPASTLGLLHGTTAQVPAFRWWSREERRMVVSNRPDDAAAVEARASDGRGLLAGGGVAVATMFSGDAEVNLLVTSRASSGLGPGQMFVRFFSSPFVLGRAVVGTVAEALKELYQGWQQAARGVRPRVSRRGWYPVLRAVSNVLLRDLTTSLVAEQLVRGAPAVCVELVDYDEIAHHAGPLRPESLRALEGLDRVLGLWEQVAAASPRRYEIVVVSDHGQSLGATFEQVVGRSLEDEVRRLMASPDPDPGHRRGMRSVAPGSGRRRTGDAETEAWGPANAALHALRPTAGDGAGRMLVGPHADDRSRAGDGTAVPEVAVVGSGNLGMVWFCREPGPLDGADVAARWPALLPGLVANPAVGVVVVREGDDVAAHGAGGTRSLVTGRVDGVDPLAAYGARAAPDLLRVSRLPDAGDVVLLSSVDATGGVHAFEGLVGSHGGLGGAQNEALLVHPAGLVVPGEDRADVDGRRMLVGAEAVHRRLLAWRAELDVRDDARRGSVEP